MKIRPEIPADVETLHAMTEAAFAPMNFSDGTEADALRRLRTDGNLTLSLVACDGDELLGHVAFSPARFTGGGKGWFALGPISVWPQFQRRGIGKSLIAKGLQHLRDDEAQGCVLIGNPDVYGSSGFVSGRFTWGGLPSAYIQHVHFGGTLPEGSVVFAPGLE